MKAIENILTVIGAASLLAGLMFVLPIFGFLCGAFSGWIVGWVFDDTFNSLFRDALHLSLAPWQIGGLLGFIGSYFRASQTNNNK